MRMYVYKMTVDDGGAPCVKDGLLSLAICKPVIRRVAPEGSLIFGFAGDSMMSSGYAGNRLIYTAVVGKRLPGQEYYPHSKNPSDRGDKIYMWGGKAFTRHPSAAYHDENDLEHDLGKSADGYPNSCVLLSETFRYFGPDGPVPQSKALCEFLHRLTQGHRCNIDDKIAQDLLALKETAFCGEYAVRQKHVTPQPRSTENHRCRPCGEGVAASNDLEFEDPDATDYSSTTISSC